jgi:hypothetical protein
MSDTKCAFCGAAMHRLTRWCQKCGKSAGNPVIPITYPTMPVSTGVKSSASFPAFSIPQTTPEPIAPQFAPAPPPPPPMPTAEPEESAGMFNFLPRSMQPENKPVEKPNAFNFLPKTMQPAQNQSPSTTTDQTHEYVAVDQGGYDNGQYDCVGVWQEGNLVVAIKDATFPNRCIKCNEMAEPERITRKLSWHNPSLFFVLYLCGPLIYMIASAITSKKLTVHLPLCTKHKERRKMLTMVGGVIVGLAILATIPAALSGGIEGFGFAVGLLLVGAIIVGIGQALVRATKIENDYVWIKGACNDFRHQLPHV